MNTRFIDEICRLDQTYNIVGTQIILTNCWRLKSMDYCDSEKILGALPPGIHLRMVKSRERFFLGLARKEKIIIIKHI